MLLNPSEVKLKAPKGQKQWNPKQKHKTGNEISMHWTKTENSVFSWNICFVLSCLVKWCFLILSNSQGLLIPCLAFRVFCFAFCVLHCPCALGLYANFWKKKGKKSLAGEKNTLQFSSLHYNLLTSQNRLLFSPSLQFCQHPSNGIPFPPNRRLTNCKGTRNVCCIICIA